VIIADLHIHGPYSEAASPRITISELAVWARRKGIDILGTGDCFQPDWRVNIDQMEQDDDTGLYYLWDKDVQFIPTTEVCLLFDNKKVHVLLVFAHLEAVDKVAKELKRFGDLERNGRPELKLNLSNLTDIVKREFDLTLVIPAHVMTPWFGALGSKNHLESLWEICHTRPDALETGLSADPQMIKRIKDIQDIPLVSFSDAHSLPNLGREVTVFDFDVMPTFQEIYMAIVTNQVKLLEYPPPLGKYHFSGHRKCGYSAAPGENVMCPKCGRRVTMGVAQRIDDLGSFSEVEVDNVIKYIIPCRELISMALAREPHTREVMEIYSLLVSQAPELKLLTDYPLSKVATLGELKQLLEHQQDGIGLKIVPGFDGEFGKVVNLYSLMSEKLEQADREKREGRAYRPRLKQAEDLERLILDEDMVITADALKVFNG